jgi:hypothetical protein
MTAPPVNPRPVSEQLLDQPRHTAGIESYGEPVRLGERDTSGHIVGYIDDGGLGWRSLSERIVATQGQRLADALELPVADHRRDRLIGRVLAGCPNELLAEVGEEAAGRLWLRGLRPTDR